ncbi:MAG TPA: zinc-dependent metalloprotease family protein, partial [Phycisphaerales bacterium]|nr:zinc-dependent metalloprotease family protein [Phycisphaerales bacterium]
MSPLTACRLMVLSLGLAAAGAPVLADPPPAVAGVPALFSVTEATVQSLATPAQSGPFAVQVFAGGAVVDVLLQPVSVRSPTFKVFVDDGSGLHETPAAPEMNFTGSAVGRPGSLARLSVVNGSWRGAIDLGDGGPLWWVQPLSDAQPGAPAGQHAVFAGDALLAGEHGCPGGVETGLTPVGGPKGGGPACIRATEIAFDADVLFYQQNGSSVAATNADIDSIVNSMNLIYGRDATTTFIVTAHIVRTSPGLYTSNVPQTLLNQMATEWQNNQMAVVRDIAHLMTGQPTGSTIGLAFNGAVCSAQFGYGFSQSRYTSNFANRVSLTCHEVGHNFSASHCDADPDCAIMCSINGGCAHNVSGFSQRSINEIRSYATASACLANAAGIAPAV